MRLQLVRVSGSLVLVAVLALAGSAAAQARPTVVRARSALYQDDDRTTISTSTVALHAGVGETLGVDARYLIDVVSSASVDVISAATGRFDELRHEAEGGVSFDDGTTRVGGAYIYSHEEDWSSHTASLGFSRDFFGHDLTLGMGGSYVANSVGRAEDRNFERSLDVFGANAQATVVASPNDIASFDYSVGYLEGYQASPYRYPRFVDADAGQQQFSPGGERHPERRARHSLTLRYNRHLFEDTALRAHARAYADDWGVRSATVGAEWVVGWGRVETGVFARGYLQRHADFYRDVYDGLRVYMTADRELSSFHDLFGGARVVHVWNDLSAFDELRLELKVTAFAFWFPEFSRLSERYGGIAELALEGTL